MPPHLDMRRVDLRKPGTHRRELFQRFYTFHLRYKSHPGGVYYTLPYMAETYGWDEEQRAWAAWLNGSTQNPVTTLLLMRQGDRPQHADRVLNYFNANRTHLPWDTDRRYWRKAFPAATIGYLEQVGLNQAAYWRARAQDGWPALWKAAHNLPTMGRLSTWSYLEYLRILNVGNVTDANTLMLDDVSGSRSHRNGLLLIDGQDHRIAWRFNPGYKPDYTPDDYTHLANLGQSLLDEARQRNPRNPDVGYLTLESALCTFKSWHVPNRRYTGVYNDLLHDRLRLAEQNHGHQFDVLWEARARHLPAHLRMEDTPNDPGAVPVKQNHFLNTGQPVTLGHDYPELLSDFDKQLPTGKYKEHRKWR